MPMDLDKLHSDLEEVIGRHAPETSRAYDMATGLLTAVKYMVVAREKGDLSEALDELELLLVAETA